jgi:hypothetical protein
MAEKGEMLFKEKPFFPIPYTRYQSLLSTYISFYMLLFFIPIILVVLIVEKGYENIWVVLLTSSCLILLYIVLYSTIGHHIYSAKPLIIYKNGIDMPRFIGYEFIEPSSIKQITFMDQTDPEHLTEYNSRFAELIIIRKDRKKFITGIKSYDQINKAEQILRANWELKDLDITFLNS